MNRIKFLKESKKGACKTSLRGCYSRQQSNNNNFLRYVYI